MQPAAMADPGLLHTANTGHQAKQNTHKHTHTESVRNHTALKIFTVAFISKILAFL